MSIADFKIKSISPTITQHPIEKRGFVKVLFDSENPSAGEIDVFYRLIPAKNSVPNDSSKPVVVVINGGPGIPSSFYRALDFDYSQKNPSAHTLDRFDYFLNTHRILLLDQRGTDGQTTPLDICDPHLDPNGVAKHFSSDSQARDYLAVIEHLIPAGEPFYIIAQSYGGMVGMQYLSLPNTRKPSGIIFSCSALPHEEMKDAMISRRQEQLQLNQQLKKAYPDIETRLQKVRDHFQSLGIDPNQINGLYTLLGKDVSGVWEKSLVRTLDQLMLKNKEELLHSLSENIGTGNILNYILSSANFTPGYTDRTIAQLTSQLIPFEPWMIDENWVMLLTGSEDPVSRKMILTMDENPPPPTPFASVEKLREVIAQNQLLFVSADNDAFVPAESYQRAFKKFEMAGHTVAKHIPGGHHAIFLEDGYQTFMEWSRSLKR